MHDPCTRDLRWRGSRVLDSCFCCEQVVVHRLATVSIGCFLHEHLTGHAAAADSPWEKQS